MITRIPDDGAAVMEALLNSGAGSFDGQHPGDVLVSETAQEFRIFFGKSGRKPEVSPILL